MLLGAIAAANTAKKVREEENAWRRKQQRLRKKRSDDLSKARQKPGGLEGSSYRKGSFSSSADETSGLDESDVASENLVGEVMTREVVTVTSVPTKGVQVPPLSFDEVEETSTTESPDYMTAASPGTSSKAKLEFQSPVRTIGERTATEQPQTPASFISGRSQQDHVIAEALVSAMDDRMADVTLIAKDGDKVPAIKFILACASPVFKDLFYVKPEKKSTEIFIGDYDGTVIRAMKEFCHTSSFRNSNILHQKDANAARHLIKLVALAKDYDIQPLYIASYSALSQLLTALPWLAPAAYDATIDEGPMTEKLFEFIKCRSPGLLLETSAMKHFSSLRLDTFLNRLDCSESQTLVYLMKWAAVLGGSSSNTAHHTFVREKVHQNLGLQTALKMDRSLEPIARSCGLQDLVELSFGIDYEFAGQQLSDWSNNRSDTTSRSNRSGLVFSSLRRKR